MLVELCRRYILQVTFAGSPDLAEVARVLASDARASMMIAMMDDRAWTLSELAAAAGVTRSTASMHVDRLVAARLVSEVRQGRHRYLRLKDRSVADVIEGLAVVTDRVHEVPNTFRARRVDAAMREARTCYRHLAGRLGVVVAEAMVTGGLISADWALTSSGRNWIEERGVALPGGRAPLTRPCLDWTERRHHLAGGVADALFAAWCAAGWLERVPDCRAVKVTDEGRRGFAEILPDLDLPDLDSTNEARGQNRS